MSTHRARLRQRKNRLAFCLSVRGKVFCLSVRRGCTAGWRDRELGRFDAYIYSMGKLHFDRTDYSIVVRIRGGGRFIAPGDQARLSSHRSTFTAWRRPIGQEKRPSGNYWTNSRSDLAKPKLSDYGVAAMSRRFPSTAQASNVQKREGVGWATDLKVAVRR